MVKVNTAAPALLVSDSASLSWKRSEEIRSLAGTHVLSLGPAARQASATGGNPGLGVEGRGQSRAPVQA
jgi:hypothetical protein